MVQEQVDKATQNLRNAMKLLIPNIATALNEIDNQGVSIYLNQSDNTLVISKVKANSTLMIYSISGQQVINQKIGQTNNIHINLQHLQAGAYIVNIASEQAFVTGKISIK